MLTYMSPVVNESQCHCSTGVQVILRLKRPHQMSSLSGRMHIARIEYQCLSAPGWQRIETLQAAAQQRSLSVQPPSVSAAAPASCCSIPPATQYPYNASAACHWTMVSDSRATAGMQRCPSTHRTGEACIKVRLSTLINQWVFNVHPEGPHLGRADGGGELAEQGTGVGIAQADGQGGRQQARQGLLRRGVGGCGPHAGHHASQAGERSGRQKRMQIACGLHAHLMQADALQILSQHASGCCNRV